MILQVISGAYQIIITNFINTDIIQTDHTTFIEGESKNFINPRQVEQYLGFYYSLTFLV